MMARNPTVTMTFVLRHMDKPWKWSDVSKLPSLTMAHVLLLPSDTKWDWIELSRHPNISTKDVLSHLYKPWDWYGVSRYMTTTMDDVLTLLQHDKPLGLFYLSRNPSITLQDVLKHPELQWDWHFVSSNKNITLQDVLKHPELPWNWHVLSNHPELTLEFVMARIEKPWDWNTICGNTNITVHDMQTHAATLERHRVDWHIHDLSRNPNLTVDDVFENLDWEVNKNDCGWNWFALSRHLFDLGNKTERLSRQRQLTRTSKFKEELVEKAWHPDRFLDWCMETEG
jgi:hypothetical protein